MVGHWLLLTTVLVGSRNGLERDLHKQTLLVTQSNENKLSIK